MQNENENIKPKRKKGKLVIAICLLFASILCFSLVLHYTMPFWHNDRNDTGILFRIGNFDIPPTEPILPDELLDYIRRYDPFLYHNIRTVHFIGDQTVLGYPDVEGRAFQQYDVLLFRLDGIVSAVQIVGNITHSQIDTWANLRSAINSTTVPLTRQGNYFREGNVYTTAHAPVGFGGSNWLARHDSVTSAPEIGTDWFLQSGIWQPQAYPQRSIITHSGNHFISVRLTTSGDIPGISDAWQQLEGVSASNFGVPAWSSTTSYPLHAVVAHAQSYWVSTLATNLNLTPGISSGWIEFTRFDPANTVRPFVEGMSLAVGDFVSHMIEGELQYFRLLHTIWAEEPSNAGGGSPWQRVHNFERLSSVSPFNSTTQFLPGMLVSHQNQVFERIGEAVNWNPLITDINFWRRILTWRETQQPVVYTSGVWSGNRIFSFTAGAATTYHALMPHLTTPTWITDPRGNPHFRHVEQFSPASIYRELGSFNDLWNSGTPGFRSHAYTIENGQRIFWEVYSAPAEGIIGFEPSDYVEINGIEQVNPHWRRHRFVVHEQTLISTIGGRYVVWDRNPNAPQIVGEPSDTENDHWIRREFPVDNPFVYTEGIEGEVILWRNIAGGTVAAPTTLEPGNPLAWERVIFRSHSNFVYTVNAAGIPSFWFSSDATSTFPSAGNPYWQYLEVYRPTLPEYFYMLNGEVLYFNSRIIDGVQVLYRMENSWTGSGSVMRNHWQPTNEYTHGDIVTYGITATNTWRYFRLRNDVADPSLATGVHPFTPLGNVFWEPIR